MLVKSAAKIFKKNKSAIAVFDKKALKRCTGVEQVTNIVQMNIKYRSLEIRKIVRDPKNGVLKVQTDGAQNLIQSIGKARNKAPGYVGNW